jgi:cation-transporting ATPase E
MATIAPAPPTETYGLDEHEALRRAAAGKANVVDDASTRSVAAILRANVVTRFNALLGSLLVVILIVGPPQDALFGLVLIGNTAVGVVQELRAKRTLDRLVVIGGATATVIRSGEARTVPSRDVVEGDLVEVGRGDQIVVDGTVSWSDGLEVDESLLTGESEPVSKPPGSRLLSGSWVVAGTGRHLAEVVGEQAYGRRLAVEGRRFSLTRSELRAGIDNILRGVTWVLVPTAVLLVASQLVQASDVEEAVRSSVAGVVNMVPEGLVLLTSTALAVGVIRLGRRKVLVQELGALEGLARVDVLCVDKTGTLTEGQPQLVGVEPLEDGVDAEAILSGFAASDPVPNASLQAIGRALPGSPWDVRWRVPFSSAERWSAIASADTVWALGAPDVLLGWLAPEHAHMTRQARAKVDERARAGGRVLLLASYEATHVDERPDGRLRPLALVVLGETVRHDAAATAAWFAEQGVELKVLSGDEPSTIGAVAGVVGIPGADAPVDARSLPEDVNELVAEVERTNVFGRVGPEQKLAIIAALQSRGHTVGMIGDGVNDVLALKQADLGIAMGNGASAARSAAQVVLLDARFSALPAIVAEGRRVIGNIEQVGKLFVTKTVYACLLAIAVGIARLPFPFFPRHLTIVSSLTIGIPAFFLALGPNTVRAEGRFVLRVLRAALPMGTVAAAATFAGYALAREEGLSLGESRTTATLVLFGVGLWVLVLVARPLTPPKRVLISGLILAFLAGVIAPGFRRVFALELPRPVVLMAVIGVVAVAGALMELGLRAAIMVGPHVAGIGRRRSAPITRDL